MSPPVTSRTAVRAMTPYTRIDMLPSTGTSSWTGCSLAGGSSGGGACRSNVVHPGAGGRTRGLRCTTSGMGASSSCPGPRECGDP